MRSDLVALDNNTRSSWQAPKEVYALGAEPERQFQLVLARHAKLLNYIGNTKCCNSVAAADLC